MFTFMEGLPPGVLGLRASGAITHEDYQRLIPKAKAMLESGPMKTLYVVDEDVSDSSPLAFWDDQMFGPKHWGDFSKVALVTDAGWMRGAARLFAAFFPAKMKIFSKAQIAEATAWISEPDEAFSSAAPVVASGFSLTEASRSGVGQAPWPPPPGHPGR